MVLSEWDAMQDDQREAYGREVEKRTDGRFRYYGLDFKHRLAKFEGPGGAYFVLIPGGEAELGFDPARAPKLKKDEQKSWAQRNGGIRLPWARKGPTPWSVFQEQLSPVRRASFGPALVERAAREVGQETIDPESEEGRQLLAAHPPRPGSKNQILSQAGSITISCYPDGTLEITREGGMTYPELETKLGQDGFRLPTNDEWEYYCSAGARTLFHWGDHVPADRFPNESGPAERAWRRKWVLSGGTLPMPEFTWDFDLHIKPNPFGLTIAYDPYHWELVGGAPEVRRGGDGGAMICGGEEPFYACWIPLSSWYSVQFDEMCGARARRIFPLE